MSMFIQQLGKVLYNMTKLHEDIAIVYNQKPN
jgi:hypothetical protein